MGGSSIPCAKTRDQLKQFEAKEDCFLIEFDPDGVELDLSNLSLSHTSHADADLTVVAEKGKIACRDYPHPRHDCATFPFGKTPDESHCELCYCYVCDSAAPCKKWAGTSKHCTAFDNDQWNRKRRIWRVLEERKKMACIPHPRYACAKFPAEKTPKESHCELCFCYVCEVAAPCKKWAGRSQHCTAFDNDVWNIKRKLKRESVNRKKEAYKDLLHPRHRCVKYPFDQTPHESHCELCYCYVCEYEAPCEEWVGAAGHCHAFNNQPWKTKRELWEATESEEEQSEDDSEVSVSETVAEVSVSETVAEESVTTSQQVQSNAVLPEDHSQEVQRSQTESSGTVESEESTDELNGEAKIYVGNLPSILRRNDWYSLFRRVGLYNIGVVREINWGSGSFGFITMNSVEAAEKAVELLDGSTLNGNVLSAKKAIPKRYGIYIGNLSPRVSNECLEGIFTCRGYKVASAAISLDRLTGRPRGYGFVNMSSENARDEAIRSLDGLALDGRVLKLNRSYWG